MSVTDVGRFLRDYEATCTGQPLILHLYQRIKTSEVYKLCIISFDCTTTTLDVSLKPEVVVSSLDVSHG